MYIDWIKYFIYNTNKYTLDTYIVLYHSYMFQSHYWYVILQAYCNIMWIIFIILYFKVLNLGMELPEVA
jgi:hypothetical protein